MKFINGIAGAVLVFGGGMAIGNIPLLSKKAVLTSWDLYARNSAGTACIHIVSGGGCPSSAFQSSSFVGASKIVSLFGSNYTLWDNPYCNTLLGGSQVSFDP